MSTRTQPDTPSPLADAGVPLSAVAAPTARRSSRTSLIVIALVTVAGGAVTYGALTSAGDRSPVVAVAAPVHAGESIERSDLTEAQVADDPALSTVSAADIDDLVGRQAAVDLVPGSLVTSEQVTDQLLPGPGQSLVGLPLKPGQLPGSELYPGDQVLVVDTPTADSNPPKSPPTPTEATVVGVTFDDVAGLTIVDLAVDEADAALLAARGQTGRVAIYLAGEAD